MKSNNTSEGPSSKRLLLYVLGTMIFTVIFFAVINSQTVKRAFRSDAEKIEDTILAKPLSTKTESTEIDCDVNFWFSKYKANPIAFNDNYTGKQIDVCGTIAEISMSLSGNAILKISSDNDGDRQVICIDEKHSWRNEIKQVIVGEIIHVRGIYYDMMLDPDNIHLEKRHIIYQK